MVDCMDMMCRRQGVWLLSVYVPNPARY